MSTHTRHSRGFIRLLLLIVVVVIVLSYFNFDLRGIIESPQTQQNFSYLFDLVRNLWANYVVGPVQAVVDLFSNFFSGSTQTPVVTP